MRTTCSKRSHKLELGFDSTLRNFLSVKTEFQFHELNFGVILLCICWELVLGPLREVEDGSKGYNLHADYTC